MKQIFKKKTYFVFYKTKLAQSVTWDTHSATRTLAHKYPPGVSLNYLNCVPVDHRLKIHDGVGFHRTRQQQPLFVSSAR